MNQRTYNKRQRFSIRKYHFGAASVLVGALLLLGQGTVSASENTASSVELAPGNLSQGDSASGETPIASIEKEESANQTFQEPSVEPQSPATVSVDADNRGYSAVAEETGDLAENDSASTQDDLDGDGFSNGAEDADDSDKNDAAPISDRLVSDVSDSEILDAKTPTSLHTTRSAADIETRSAEERAAYVGSERSASNFDIDPTLRSATQLADQYEISGNKTVYIIYKEENSNIRPDETLKEGLVLKEIATGKEITDKATIELLVKSVELGVYKGNRAKVDNNFPNAAAGMGTRAFTFNYKVTFVDNSEINQIQTREQNNGDYKLIPGMPTNSLYVLPGVTMQGKTDLVYEIGADVPLNYTFEDLKKFYTATISANAFDTLKDVVDIVTFEGSNVLGNKLKTDKVGSYQIDGGFSVKDQKTQQDIKDFSVRVPFTYRVIDKSKLREEIEKVKENLTTKLYNDATQTTKDTYDKALDQAKLVEQDPKTTQELIYKAQEELEEARLGLELQPVVKAEEAHQAVADKITEVSQDGLVSPADQQAVQELIDKAKQLKADADQVVKDLPAGEEQTKFQDRLDKLSDLTAPAVTDADNDGQLDTEEYTEAEEAVKKAEEAHQAVADKITEVSQDGLVSPADQQAVQELIDKAKQLKADADQVVKDLPAGEEQTKFQDRLDKLSDLTAPAVTDADNDGQLDTEEYTEAEEAVKKAEEAHQAVADKITEVSQDGLVSPADQQAVQELIDKAKQLKADADQVVKDLPAGEEQTKFQDRLDKLSDLTAPAVTDADNDGQLDTEEYTEAEEAVKKAEEAHQAVADKITEVSQDGLVSPADQQAVQELIDKAKQLKADADQVVKDLPAGEEQTKFQDRLDKLSDLTAPAVTDADNDGQLDTEEYTEAEEAVKKAEEAHQAVADKITEVSQDGLVSPADQQAVQELIDKAKQLKADADQVVKDLPAGEEQTKFQDRLDKLSDLTAPAVTDADNDGQLDTEEYTEAEEAVKKAEEAHQAVADKITEVSQDGLVSPADQQAVQELIDKAKQLKADADQVVKDLPAGEEQTKFQDRLDKLSDLTAPAVTDADNDGQLDTEEYTEAEEAVKKAEEAHQAVADKITEVSQDGLVSPADQQAVQELIDKAKQLKADADQVVKDLPAGEEQTKFQDRLDKLSDLTAPAVTDADNDGQLDTEEYTEAEEAVKKAEEAHQAVADKITEVSQDGLVSPADQQAVQELIDKAKQLKADADQVVKDLPAGEEQTKFQDRLDKLSDLTAPAVTDADNDGQLDTEEYTEAEEAVKKAEEAHQAVADKITEVSQDGLVSPADQQAVQELIDKAKQLKADADQVVKDLPAGEEQTKFQDRLDKLSDLTAPAVTDADNDGQLDTEEYTEAEEAVKKAEEAHQAVADKITEVSQDGLVSPADQQAVQELIDKAKQLKADADQVVKDLPAGEEQTKFQDRLDKLSDLTAPAVTDADNDGQLDTEEYTEAEEAVKKAEEAHQAVADKITEVSQDGLVSPADQQAVQELIDKAKQLKADADQVVKDLPAGEEQTKFQDRLDKLSDLTAPAVTDADNDGQLDTEEYTEAEEAVKKAEEAHQAVADKITEVSQDGLVSPADQQAVQELIDKAKQLKADADQVVKDLPAGEEQTKFQDRLDKLSDLTAPAVTDADNDGQLDTEEYTEAEEAVKKAEEAHQAVADKITEVSQDGLVSPADQQAVQELIDKAKQLKADADQVVKDLPAGEEQTKFQDRLDKLSDLTAPAVTDADNDGQLDTEEYTEAEEAVKKAEEAHQAVADKITEVSQDGLVSPADQQAVQLGNKKAIAKKESKYAKDTHLPSTGDDSSATFAIAGLAIIGLGLAGTTTKRKCNKQ